MKNVSVVQKKGCLVPERERVARDALKHLWASDTREVDLQEPEDLPPLPVPPLDD